MMQRDWRPGATARIAEFVDAVDYAKLPAHTVAAAKTGILDGIANLLAGTTQPLANIISDYTRRLGGSPLCTVVGRKFKTNAPAAAFANGVFLHCLDYEIQGQPVCHGTSAILPTGLALGEMHGASGQRLIEAYVVGWEVQQRLRRASIRCSPEGVHPPGLIGPIGATAASAKMLGLDAKRICMALGVAASHTGGLTINTGTMVKATHPAGAARTGVEAALLAEAGFISNAQILDVKRGYIDTHFGADFNWEALTSGLGDSYQLDDPGFNIKRYPAQLYMQWTIEAVINLQTRHHIAIDQLAALELEVPAGLVRPDHDVATSGLDGKFDFTYCGAVAFAQGKVDIDSFSDASRFSPEVEAVLAKVRLKPDHKIPSNLPDTWAVARAVLNDGRVLTETCRNYHGSIAHPMNRAERLEKFRSCARYSLAPEAIERVIDLAERLETLPDLSELCALLA